MTEVDLTKEVIMMKQKTLKQICEKSGLFLKKPYYKCVIYWLEQNKIDTNPETTELIGAEIYDAEIINAFIDEKLLEELNAAS